MEKQLISKNNEAFIIKMAELNFDAYSEIMFRKEKESWNSISEKSKNEEIIVMRRFLYKFFEYFGGLS